MTAVVDASVLAEVVASTERAAQLLPALAEHRDALHIPHLAIVETASVLRGWVLGGELTAERARLALADLADFPATRWDADPLLPRMWVLRNNVTAYDATYVALAESLDAELITCDRKLVRSLGDGSPIAITVL
jgi:predicted nucleic acid-binding protein